MTPQSIWEFNESVLIVASTMKWGETFVFFDLGISYQYVSESYKMRQEQVESG